MIFIIIFLTADVKDVPMQELSRPPASGCFSDATIGHIPGKGLRKLKTAQKQGMVNEMDNRDFIRESGERVE